MAGNKGHFHWNLVTFEMLILKLTIGWDICSIHFCYLLQNLCWCLSKTGTWFYLLYGHTLMLIGNGLGQIFNVLTHLHKNWKHIANTIPLNIIMYVIDIDFILKYLWVRFVNFTSFIFYQKKKKIIFNSWGQVNCN